MQANRSRRSSKSISGGAKRLRGTVACYVCHKRKTKCKGYPGRCDFCRDNNKTCEYPEVEPRASVPQSYYEHLRNCERVVLSHARLSDDDVTVASADETFTETELSTVISNLNDLNFSRSGDSTRMAEQLSPAPRYSAMESMLQLQSYDELYTRRPPSPISLELPSYKRAMRLWAKQHEYIGTIFSFVQPSAFEARFQKFSSWPLDPQDRDSCLEYCSVLMVLAFGQLYSVNEARENNETPGIDYFKGAMHYLPALHEQGSVLFVEVLSLVGYFMQILQRRDAAYLYIGVALRMAIALDLHEEVTDVDIDLNDRERRRRVWWSVFSMDRILSVKSGNPITVHDADIEVALPEPVPGFDIDPSPARVLRHYTQLSQILGKIGEDVYRKKHNSGEDLLVSMKSILDELLVCFASMPAELQLDLEDPALDIEISREAVSTYLHYYQCVNMTARPLLFYVSHKRQEALAAGITSANWYNELPNAVESIIKRTVVAARDSTTISTKAMKHNLFATYGFMDGEHAFSSALTLTMAKVSSLSNNLQGEEVDNERSLEMARAILETMSSKGNDYAQRRLELLDDLLLHSESQGLMVATAHRKFPGDTAGVGGPILQQPLQQADAGPVALGNPVLDAPQAQEARQQGPTQAPPNPVFNIRDFGVLGDPFNFDEDYANHFIQNWPGPAPAQQDGLDNEFARFLNE